MSLVRGAFGIVACFNLDYNFGPILGKIFAEVKWSTLSRACANSNNILSQIFSSYRCLTAIDGGNQLNSGASRLNHVEKVSGFIHKHQWEALSWSRRHLRSGLGLPLCT